ncbi:YebC/PmpR family DNA-binding transcriptional regulator [Blattabacterium cuenoti]|uniref:YebC/PmpR family DNA-binding transcriptional regulator n=1 Tax=Blattabacterium cuenoti TaxID=1653831 RepID=UPI00163C7D1D|nr:YebC/PmpR family DNA-binding transcriptional regulator [Blattabacterium cuenoti]
MSGHSKWSNIQHRKSNKDFKKSKIFSKIIKEISIAVRESGKNSFRLKNAIANAKSFNVPKNSIEKAIEKNLKIKKNNYKNIIIEGRIHGISMIIECTTDNNIRTMSNVRSIIHKNGGRLCKNGELNHLYRKIGIFHVKEKNINSSIEDFELMVIDFGAKDFIKNNNIISIYTDFSYFGAMKKNLEKLEIFYHSEINYIPKINKNISNDKNKKVLDLIEKLKNNEDVDNVYSDFDIKIK